MSFLLRYDIFIQQFIYDIVMGTSFSRKRSCTSKDTTIVEDDEEKNARQSSSRSEKFVSGLLWEMKNNKASTSGGDNDNDELCRLRRVMRDRSSNVDREPYDDLSSSEFAFALRVKKIYEEAVKYYRNARKNCDEDLKASDVGITILLVHFSRYYAYNSYPSFVNDFSRIDELKILENFLHSCIRTYCKLPRDLATHKIYGLKANEKYWLRSGGGLPLTVKAFKELCQTIKSKSITPLDFIRKIRVYDLRVVESFYLLANITGDNKVVKECIELQCSTMEECSREIFDKESRLDGGSHVSQTVSTYFKERVLDEQSHNLASSSSSSSALQLLPIHCLIVGKPVYWFNVPVKSVWFIYRQKKCRFFGFGSRDDYKLLMNNLSDINVGVVMGYVHENKLYPVRIISPHVCGDERYDYWFKVVNFFKSRGLNCPLRPVVIGYSVVTKESILVEDSSSQREYKTLVTKENLEKGRLSVTYHYEKNEEDDDDQKAAKTTKTKLVEEIVDPDIYKSNRVYLVKTG